MVAGRLAWAAALVLAGCTVGPDFRPPEVRAPGDWGPERADVRSHTTNGDADPRWWTQFGDPELSSLVARIAAQSLDLQTAAERVLQARAQREVVASQGLPQVSGRGSYDRTRISPTGNPGAIVVAKPGAPLEFDVFQYGLNSSWDLDLFGRVRRQTEAANADTEAAVEDRRGVALAAVADLAQDYLQLRGVQAQRTIAEHNEELARRTPPWCATSSPMALPPRSTWRGRGRRKLPSPPPCRHCARRRRPSSTPSGCCWASRLGRLRRS